MSPESTAPSGQALPAGTRLEEFEVERVLGTGGFGITYLARDVKLGRQVVIKENLPAQFAFRDPTSLTVSPRNTVGEDAESFAWSLENFSREASTLASLDHPGIVPVMRSFEAFGTSYFVMPYMEGLPLDELMKNRRERGEEISDDELRGLLEHVLDALGYLHSRGIYHRDIKPGNILVTKEGVPILIDFGSARQRLSERSMTVVESAGYTPFEQLQSRGNVGPWSDLYSLGATVAKAITGEAPPKAMDRMKNDPYVWLASRPALQAQYSGALLSSLDRVLAVEESDRWQDAGQWQQALVVEEPVPPVAVALGAPVAVTQPPVAVAPVPPVAVAPVPPVAVAPVPPIAVGAPLQSSASGAPDGGQHVTWPQVSQGAGMSSAWGREDSKKISTTWKVVGVIVLVVVANFLSNFVRECSLRAKQARSAEGHSWYQKGRKAKDDVEKAEYFRKSAKWGHGHGAYSLGVMYSKGRGVEQDYREAMKWFRKAAMKPNESSPARVAIGDLYSNGLGVEKDEAEAMKWYHKAAEKGYARAQFEIGLMYAEGRGVAKDDTEAVRWYRKAAEEGSADAIFELGLMYTEGRGVAKDDVEAVKWYRTAAVMGHSSPQAAAKAKEVLRQLGVRE